jgi:hypothetical protein
MYEFNTPKKHIHIFPSYIIPFFLFYNQINLLISFCRGLLLLTTKGDFMFNINDYLSKLEEFFELRNLADKTRENYLSSLNCYLSWLQENCILPEDATYEDIRNFLRYLKLARDLTKQTINYYISKIRFSRFMYSINLGTLIKYLFLNSTQNYLKHSHTKRQFILFRLWIIFEIKPFVL